MAYNVVIVLVTILLSISYHTVASEDCELAGKPDKDVNPPKEINARRQGKTAILDKLDPAVKYKFGITYPLGVSPHSGYMPNKVTIKTPPTNFFPMGSSVHTITMLPLPHMYLNTHSQGDRICDFLLRGCMRVYDTGYVCARALQGVKMTYTNYCAMKFTNCRLKTDDFDIEGDNFLEAAIINEPPFNPLTGQQESLF